MRFYLKNIDFFYFPDQFVKLVMKCISSSRMSVLFNGEKLQQFLPSRGIRQGDPISLYLFILCMEFLSVMIENEVEKGKWKGIRLGRGAIFFADDVLLFSLTDENSCESLKSTLETFCNISGQKVNLAKSSILFSKNTPARIRRGIVRSLGVKETYGLGKYLGFPMDMSAKRTNSFQFLIDKVKNKLDGWKAKFLSMSGRTTLINSTLSALPTHIMQCTLLHRKFVVL